MKQYAWIMAACLTAAMVSGRLEIRDGREQDPPCRGKRGESHRRHDVAQTRG